MIYLCISELQNCKINVSFKYLVLFIFRQRNPSLSSGLNVVWMMSIEDSVTCARKGCSLANVVSFRVI
jgi:hypothetical protein